MAKKKTAAKQTAKTTATKQAQASVSDSPTVADRPQTTSATEKHARSGENRNVTAVNTGEGYKETDVTQKAEPETPEEKPTDSCQNLRGNGDTCLDELAKAKENPNRFTQEQLKDILAGNNLCEYCMEQE